MNLFDNSDYCVFKIDWAMANAFVAKHHRHSNPTTGHIFSLGLYKEGILVGVAICGRPVSRHLDNGTTIEINRLCTDGTRNACSQLYAACIKYAKRRKYSKVITYTLASESGASLKASNFVLETEKAGGLKWTGKRKHVSLEYKKRWAFTIQKKAA